MKRTDRFLLQLAGAPGTGKSGLARAIADVTGAVVLDADVVKSAILDSGVEWPAAGPAGYSVLFALAADLLDQGRSVIVDSPSHYATIPERGLAISGTYGVTYRFIECVCDDDDQLEQRMAGRAPRPSQMRGVGRAPLASTGAMSPNATQVGQHRWKTFGPANGHLRLDTRGGRDSYVPAALAYVAGEPHEERGER